MSREKIKNLPMLSGVYLMKNQEGVVIYVGKAKRLKNKVSSYFYQDKQHSRKVLRVIHRITDFDFVVVDTELDALLLKCQLIQHYHPFYSRQMNYFGNYNYVHISNKGFVLTDTPTARTYGPFRLYKKMLSILRIMGETYQMPWLSEISLLALRVQPPYLQEMTFEQKKKEIQGLSQGRNKKLLTYLKKRQQHFIYQLNFEETDVLQKDIESVIYFIRRIQRQKQFLGTPSFTFSIPLATDNNQKKCYLICYEQLAETMIASRNNPPDFYYKKREALLSLKCQLSKEEIDPVQILISYRKKLEREQIEVEQLNKKEAEEQLNQLLLGFLQASSTSDINYPRIYWIES